MKKRKVDIWREQIKTVIRGLHFSALEPSIQNSLKREMLYFNNSRVLVIAVMILILEAINIVNVICFSESGLATANNRLYFAMYLILSASALLCLVVRHVLRNHPELLSRCYVGFTLIWVLWHAVLSSIDLRHNPNIVVFVTGILSMSLLMRMKPMQMLPILASGLLALFFCGGKNLSNGIIVNAIIVTVITMLVFCSRYYSSLEELGYRQKMILQENNRVAGKQKLTLLSQQQKALLSHSKEILFLWDKELDTLAIAGGKSLCEADRETLLAWLTEVKESKEGTVLLQFDAENVPCEYLIESTPQFDCDDRIIGAAGLITKITKACCDQSWEKKAI